MTLFFTPEPRSTRDGRGVRTRPRRVFTADLTVTDGRCVVHVRELPGLVVTTSCADAEREIRDAISLALTLEPSGFVVQTVFTGGP